MAESANYRLQQLTSIADIDAVEWNRLAENQPLMSHEFLSAMEHAGCIGGDTAWQPCHILLRDGAKQLVGALPLYSKYDSRGEFVFDWSWADAYERAGIAYYPKLVSAVPFTPATGARLLVQANADRDRG